MLKALDAANRLIAKLKAEITGLKQELSEYKSVRSKLRTSDLERENAELRGKVQRYENVIQRNHLWLFFRPRREKAATRDDARCCRVELRNPDFLDWERPDRAAYHLAAPYSKISLFLRV